VNARLGATLIDATGKFVMPGIIDCTLAIALDARRERKHQPIPPHMMMRDALITRQGNYRALAAALLLHCLLHGSANMIGGHVHCDQAQIGWE